MPGTLTTHVLDHSIGKPANGMRIDLRRLENEQSIWIQSFKTNEDGRVDSPLLEDTALTAGLYELVFYAADYFCAQQSFDEQSVLFPHIPIRFVIQHPDEHYHIPLLLTPWSYSTYRGS